MRAPARISGFAVAAALTGGLLACSCSSRVASPLPPDAGAVTARDAGVPVTVDAGERSDAGVPARDAGEEPDAGTLEPEVGDDERPSDDPAADLWRDPDPAASGPCCEMIGTPLMIDSDETQGSEPDVEWNGAGWGVAWGFDGPWFRPLDSGGLPSGLVRLGPGGDRAFDVSLEWSRGRYALATPTELRIFGLDGVVHVGGSTLLAPETTNPHIARYQRTHQWAVVSGDESIRLQLVDDTLTLSSPIPLGTGISGARVAVRASRLSVVWPSTTHGVVQMDVADPIDPFFGPYPILDVTQMNDSLVEAVGFRDDVVVTAMDGLDVWAVVTDPFDQRVVAGPNVIAHSGIVDRRAGIAPAEERGFLAVCIPTGMGPAGGSDGHDGVELLLIDAHAQVIGSSITVTSDLRNIGGCAVGWSGSDLLVAWWHAAGGATGNNEVYVQRARILN